MQNKLSLSFWEFGASFWLAYGAGEILTEFKIPVLLLFQYPYVYFRGIEFYRKNLKLETRVFCVNTCPGYLPPLPVGTDLARKHFTVVQSCSGGLIVYRIFQNKRTLKGFIEDKLP